MKYRIKKIYLIEDMPPMYVVQVRSHFNIWVDVKPFQDEDVNFAKLQAEELLEKLPEE